MKIKSWALGATLILLLSLSCKKSIDDAIDCFAEALSVSMQHNADAGNSKTINFQMSYTGSHAISSITWDFGDGQTQTVSTTTVSHTYNVSGNYEVKTKVNINEGSKTCTVEPKKSITVN